MNLSRLTNTVTTFLFSYSYRISSTGPRRIATTSGENYKNRTCGTSSSASVTDVRAKHKLY